MSDTITAEADTAGLSRVRLGRIKEGGMSVIVDGKSRSVRTVRTTYLDGHERSSVSVGASVKEREVVSGVVPARTKELTDYGRLSLAAKALAQSMAAFGPDNEPSVTQLAVFVQGYQNLQEWRSKARERMAQAEGQIDVVGQMLGRML